MTSAGATCKGLRLLLVGPYPPPFGGIASHLTTLVPGLKAQGAEDIAAVSFGPKESVEQHEGLKLYRFDVRRHGWRLLNPLRWRVLVRSLCSLAPHGLGIRAILRESVKAMLVDRVAREHASKVVSFYQSDMSIELLPLARLWGGERAIVLSCFGEIYESPDFFSRQKGLFSELLAAPAAVVSSSRHCARSFTSIGVTRSIEAVYYGVELDGAMSAELRGKFRADRRIRPDEVVVLFMGRFVKEMGLDVLLRAAPLLLGRNQAIRLLIAGARGDLSAQAAAYAAVHEQRVHVMTDVPFSQQSAVYSAADILVAPSFNQRACMGMAIKEAMAASLPVVGGAGGGVPEAIADGETGLLVPLDPATGAVDVQQLVASVLRLAEDPVLRKALGAAGRRRAEHLFSHESTNRRMAEIFMAASAC